MPPTPEQEGIQALTDSQIFLVYKIIVAWQALKKELDDSQGELVAEFIRQHTKRPNV